MRKRWALGGTHEGCAVNPFLPISTGETEPTHEYRLISHKENAQVLEGGAHPEPFSSEEATAENL